ncbi:Exostosin-like [Macleaya cordata]|uniref:Exostosin-like n=1 Tax=Macleaya cordata TaxID=56857 RepID=A0A200R1F9_MACCD|nr:Exostosin-like [Macleaya cordata]
MLMTDYVYGVMSPVLGIENGIEPTNREPTTYNGLEPVGRFSVDENRVRENDQEHVIEHKTKPVTKQAGTRNGHEPVSQLSIEENGNEPVSESSVEEGGEEQVKQLPTKENGTELVLRNEAESINRPSVNELPNTTNGIEPVNEHASIEEDKEEHYVEREPEPDPCSGRYIYVHNLPRKFNEDLIKECRTLSVWVDMCPFMSNAGLGPRIGNSQGVFSTKGWFATNQFTLEIIFHNRMKQYKCLTNNSSLASAIYVPFYAGLDIVRYLWGYNISTRDATSLDLVKWLKARPEWKVLGGRDHFLVAGRITWDFRRLTDKDSDWGNKLMTLPETKNMSMLVIEASPWHRNDFGVPYPTYFHPSSDNEVYQWQNRMRRQKKRYLFSFAGAPRPNMTGSIRSQIIEQCLASKRKCKLLDCNKGTKTCHRPSNVMKMFQSSVFCLEPPGDSYTRRSAFDSILAGCIPVFFHPGSAYVQYTWFLPRDYKKYSVLIPENDVRDGKVNIESILQRIPKEQVRAMREEVIKLIPKVIYADPRSRLESIEDAFDIAVKGVIERVNKVRRDMREGRSPDAPPYVEDNTWKYSLFGIEGEHEWDHFFTDPK